MRRYTLARMNARTLEKEALALPVEERARLAELLLESLDSLSEEDAEKLWLDEAERRATKIDEGAVTLVSSEELERRARAALK
jgi:putative addiction module component (TIGR02574 family)